MSMLIPFSLSMTRGVNREDITWKYHCLHDSCPICWNCYDCGRLTQNSGPCSSWQHILSKETNCRKEREKERVMGKILYFLGNTHYFKAVFCSPENLLRGTLVLKKVSHINYKRYLTSKKHQSQHRNRGTMKKAA